jgi:hypothetical protein
MSASDEAKKKAAATHYAAADFFDHPANTFWERDGRRTVNPKNKLSTKNFASVSIGRSFVRLTHRKELINNGSN